MLQFDQPLDLSRAKIGRLVGGQSKGQVTIRSDWKEPGPEDDLLIVTASDIQLTEQTISTPNPVDFRWGPHFGRGQDMVIKLLAGPPQPGKEGPARTSPASSPSSCGTSNGCTSTWAAGAHRRSPKARKRPGSSVPVEINCRGPFRFDVVGRVATFRDRVDVMKANPSGPSDQIACDFSRCTSWSGRRRIGQAAAKPDPKAAGSLDLVAAADRSPRQSGRRHRAQPEGTVVARGSGSSTICRPTPSRWTAAKRFSCSRVPNEIHARSLYYQSAGPGRLGRVVAQGPGWLRGQSADRPDQQLEAAWKDQLRVDAGQTRASDLLDRRCRVELPGRWPTPGAGDILLARGDAAGGERTNSPDCGPTACRPATTST